MLLPVRYQEPLTALLRLVGRVVVSKQKVETTQDAGCDTDHCNQEPYAKHWLSFGENAALLSEGYDEKRRAPVDCSVVRTGEVDRLTRERPGLDG
jgi:hypothetical protein